MGKVEDTTLGEVLMVMSTVLRDNANLPTSSSNKKKTSSYSIRQTLDHRFGIISEIGVGQVLKIFGVQLGVKKVRTSLMEDVRNDGNLSEVKVQLPYELTIKKSEDRHFAEYTIKELERIKEEKIKKASNRRRNHEKRSLMIFKEMINQMGLSVNDFIELTECYEQLSYTQRGKLETEALLEARK